MNVSWKQISKKKLMRNFVFSLQNQSEINIGLNIHKDGFLQKDQNCLGFLIVICNLHDLILGT